MDKKFLPVGSVVILKDASKKLMVTGFCSMTPEHKGKIFDYTGCLYPEGLLSSDQICLFNNDQIEKVFFKGYVTEEETEFKKQLNDNYATIEELAKNQN